MNVPVKQGISYKDVPIASHGGGGMLMPQTFGEVVAFSEIMARSQHAIPKHLRDVPGACLAVAMQAMRWAMDPFLVASKSYNVKDIIAYEAQLIAAVVHTRAPLKTRPDYAYTGEGQDLRCTVSALFDDGVTRSYESPRIAEITTKNSPLWKADPGQQLGYYSIRAFARRYCPEVILGVYTPEEAETFRGPDNARDVTPRPSLSDRLANSPASGDGFSQSHVISEIGGDTQSPPATGDASQEASLPESEPQTSDSTNSNPRAKEPKADAADLRCGVGAMGSSRHVAGRTATTTSEIMDVTAGETAPHSNPLQSLSPQTVAAAASADAIPPVPSVDANPSPDEGEKSGGDGVSDSTASSSLPVGWGILYAAALRAAPDKKGLTPAARKYWAQYGGWGSHKDGPDAQTAIAIFDAFSNNFGRGEVIDFALRELI